MRLFLALLVFYSLQEFKPYTFDDQSVPRGLAHVFNLTFLHNDGPVDLSAFERIAIPGIGSIRLHGPGWYDTIVLSSAVIGALYAWGRGLLITLPLLALLHTVPWTLSNSQGYTHHGHQLVSMVLIVQSIVVWSWQIRAWRGKPALPAGLVGHLIYYSQGMIAFSYLACAITKLINTKGLWLWRSNYICIELIKSQRLEYYANLDPAYAGDPPSALWLLTHPWTTRLIFDIGFPAAVVATVVFAVPATIRLTAHGLRGAGLIIRRAQSL